MTAPERSTPKVLLADATGYVGGRLIKPLEDAGYALRCLARKPEYLDHRIRKTTETIAGDLLQPDNLDAAFKGVDIAYYSIHSMGPDASFEEEDRRGQWNDSP